MKHLLSVDYDFFIHENPIWDWGHSEYNSIFRQMAWTTRYICQNLYKETDINKYADFKPEKILLKLMKLGFTFRDTKVRIADSHKWAFNESLDLDKCIVYNFDAHHDLWQNEGSGIDCSNWLYKAIDRGYVKGVHWIAPSWSKRYNEDEDYWFTDGQHPEIQGHYYNQLQTNQFRVNVDTIFFCRSSAWVPPHHDKDFLKMVQLFVSIENDVKFIEPLVKRKCLTKGECEAAVRKMNKGISKIRPSLKSITKGD